MRILIGGGSIREISAFLMENPQLHTHTGWFATPTTLYPFQTYQAISGYLGLDNGAFTDFNESRYLNMVHRCNASLFPVKWITLPDVVGDAKATRDLFDRWQDRVSLPKAFVAQDGAESLELPWDRFVCLFIGGTTDWKLSRHAGVLIKEARKRDKTVHMGRVNSQKRIRYAYQLGVDSVDGSGYNKMWKKYLIRDLMYLFHLENQCFINFD